MLAEIVYYNIHIPSQVVTLLASLLRRGGGDGHIYMMPVCTSTHITGNKTWFYILGVFCCVLTWHLLQNLSASWLTSWLVRSIFPRINKTYLVKGRCSLFLNIPWTRHKEGITLPHPGWYIPTLRYFLCHPDVCQTLWLGFGYYLFKEWPCACALDLSVIPSLCLVHGIFKNKLHLPFTR